MSEKIPSPVSEEGIYLQVEAEKSERIKKLQEAQLVAKAIRDATQHA